MQNKKAIKYILMFVFTLVVFGYNTMEVGAADKEFPVYGRDCNKETTAKVDIYDHCSYRMSSVERYYVSYVVGVSVPAYRIGDYYHSKELIMVRSNNDTILLADPNYGCDGGGSSPFISAYNNKAYTWDNSGINQTIMIATPISKVHLIQSTGETTCPKLCFIETSGSLSIYTNDDFLEKYSNDIEAGVFDSNKLVWPCADGTLIKGSQTKEQANSKTTECDDTKKAALTAKYQELYKNMESYYNSKISETKAAYERSYEEGIYYENGAQHNMIVKNNSQIT